MEATSFVIEYHSETRELSDDLKAKLEQRLDKLARRHHDITGASLAVHNISGANRHQEYKVRLVVYHKPDNMVAIRKGDTVQNTLLEALDAIERQVRDYRERRRESHRRRR